MTEGVVTTHDLRAAESMPVQLTRMEGKIDGVVEKVSDLRTEVTQHRNDIASLKSGVQQLESDSKSAARALVDADKGRDATAAALKGADEKRVADAKAIVDQSTQRWTPIQRIYATLGGFSALLASVYYITHPHG